MLNIIIKVLWGIATIMLLSSGIYFTYHLNFIQFKINKINKSLKCNKLIKKGIKPIETLTIALGSRIGVGSLAGVALSIYFGGIGSVFWMWISAIICSTNAFSESVLAVLYRQKQEEYIYEGGPSYYIERGLKKPFLAKVYASIILGAYILGFLTIQSNTIVKSIIEVININPIIISLIIVFLSLSIILKGIKKIATITNYLVPIMIVIYLIVAFFILIININKIPIIIKSIIISAFNFKAINFGFITTVIIGIQRGIFSNEAGIGSGAIASAVANNSPVKQGFIQILGVYITTLIICTTTALVIISSNYNNLIGLNINGIEITQMAFQYHIGNIGNYIVMISIILFAFSTIITGYYYGESNLKFLLKKKSNIIIFIFKIIVSFLLFMGGILPSVFIWNIVDIFVVLMAIINIYAILLLRDKVINEYKNN